MTRQERFEAIWAAQHFVPVESLPQHRWITQDGYRDPAMAAHYRTFCNALDSIIVELPDAFDKHESGDFMYWAEDIEKAITEAGVKVA